jgi:hypothetical protein
MYTSAALIVKVPAAEERLKAKEDPTEETEEEPTEVAKEDPTD